MPVARKSFGLGQPWIASTTASHIISAGDAGAMEPRIDSASGCYSLLSYLKRNCAGQVSAGASTNLQIPAEGVPLPDWILIADASTFDPFKSELGLEALRDFPKVSRTDGRSFLLTKRARNHPIKLEGSDMAERQTIVYGTLDWRVQWPPRFLDAMVPKGSVDTVLEEGVRAQ
jgi:hypothetical protein